MMQNSKSDRIREIIKVFIKYGLKKGLRSSIKPTNVRLAIEELGPTFVKIGQILSTRPDIIPPEYLKELQKLQDNVKPERYEIIKAAIEKTLHSPLEQLFSEFEKEAIASASIAEVHRAKLLSGERVVVKIQRPNAKETILNDLAILKQLHLFYRFFPTQKIMNFTDVLAEIENNVKLELDFLNEASNIKKFQECNKDIKFIVSPIVYDSFTTSNILVMQYIDGIKIDDVAALDEQGYDRHDIGRKLADNYIKQILEDGFFHADPHPGNIMILGNKIAYVDFGLMGSLNENILTNLNEVFHSIALGDAEAMAKAIQQIGVSKGPVNTERLSGSIDGLFAKYISTSFNELNMSEIVKDIFKICRDGNIAIPREMMIIGKGLLAIESVLAKVSPDISILNVAINYEARRFFKEKSTKRNILEIIRNLYLFSSICSKIPAKLLKLIDSAQAGQLTIKLDDTKRERNMDNLNRIVNRIVFGLVVSSLVIGSAIVISANAGPKIAGMSVFGIAGFTGAAILGFWLVISIIKSSRM
jgi:ubiquinone biosynthesis protein